jgi:hypothetical protein
LVEITNFTAIRGGDMNSSEILKVWAGRDACVVREVPVGIGSPNKTVGRMRDARGDDVIIRENGKDVAVTVTYEELERFLKADLILEMGQPGSPEARIYKLKQT